MSGALIGQTLELWWGELCTIKAQIRWLSGHASVAASASAFLDGLLGPERRETGWMRAEAAGDPGPWGRQAVLGRSRWDADALRDLVRGHALGALTAPDAVLVVDETGSLKQGKASCGVGRQHTGPAGKIADCRIGVFAAYVSDEGHAFIDRRLYLPKAWTDVPARLAAAYVPPAWPRRTCRPPGRGVRAARGGLRHQAADRGRHDRARHPRRRAVRLGRGRQRLRRGRGRDRLAPGRQGLRAGRRGRPPLRVLGQAARRERHGGGDRGRV